MQTSIFTFKYIQPQSKLESNKENQRPKLNAVHKFGAKNFNHTKKWRCVLAVFVRTKARWAFCMQVTDSASKCVCPQGLLKRPPHSRRQWFRQSWWTETGCHLCQVDEAQQLKEGAWFAWHQQSFQVPLYVVLMIFLKIYLWLLLLPILCFTTVRAT